MFFLYPWFLWLFFLLIPLGFLSWHFEILKLRFYQFHKTGSSSPLLRFSLLLLSFSLFFIALSRPVGDPQPISIQKKGISIAFLIDVSRSMLAQDLRPNRLERLKIELEKFMDTFPDSAYALLVFAGETILKAPFTYDLSYLKQALDEISIESVPKGGTELFSALESSYSLLFEDINQKKENSLMIVFTDGEDLGNENESFITEINTLPLWIFFVGVGKPEKTLLPDTYYQGAPVYSSVNEVYLKELSQKFTKSAYLSFSNESSLSALPRLLPENLSLRSQESTLYHYREYYWIFSLLGGIALLSYLFFHRFPRHQLADKKKGVL